MEIQRVLKCLLNSGIFAALTPEVERLKEQSVPILFYGLDDDDSG